MKTVVAFAGLDLGVLVFYLAIVLFLGLWVARRTVATKKDYFLAGDRLSWWVVGGSMVAANISTHHFVGVMGLAYTYGFTVLFVEWGAIFTGMAALLWIFLPFYLRNGLYTVPEYLARRFGQGPRMVYVVLVLLTYVLVEISAVLYMGALVFQSLMPASVLNFLQLPGPLPGVLQSLLPNYWLAPDFLLLMACVLLMAVLTGVYTIVGGLRSVIWTEMLQLAVLTAGGLSLAVLVLRKTGGLTGFLATSKDWHLLLPASHPCYPWTMYLGGITCISVFYLATNQFMVQRCLAARNEWHARMGVVFYAYFTLIRPWMTIVPGIMAVKLLPQLAKPDMVFPTLVQTLLPAGLAGLVIAGLVAAVMSHVSGALNACMTIVTVDIYLPYIRRNAGDAQAVRFGRIVGVLLVLLGVLWVPLIAHRQQVFNYLLDAYGYFTPGIATMFLLGVFWPRATGRGVLSGTILSIPMTLAMDLWLCPHMANLNRTGIVFWTCMAVAVGGSLLTKPRPAAELRGLIWTRDCLSTPRDAAKPVGRLRNPNLWYLLLLGFILSMYVIYR